MNLYKGGFRHIQGLTAAENEQEAVKNLEEKLNLRALPVEVELITEVDGYKITLADPKTENKRGIAKK